FDSLIQFILSRYITDRRNQRRYQKRMKIPYTQLPKGQSHVDFLNNCRHLHRAAQVLRTPVGLST
ncbi:MAG: hypothetical protein AAEJ59_01110, partial [Arenicellales bacterium]